MRHNQNGRRFRGRNNNNNNNSSSNNSHGHGNRRINPRVHTFDSNGPDVRIRGNAMQITEKYAGLARDAQAGGDRVLAESYLQHAEHYQRLLNELTEEQNRYQQQNQNNQNNQPHHNRHNGDDQDGREATDGAAHGTGDQPDVPLEDLDQGFLVGKRNVNGKTAAAAEDASEQGDEEKAEPPARAHGRRAGNRQKSAETV